MKNKYLLDASALLALLQDEPGAKKVAKNFPSSAISTVNLAEVASVLNKTGMPEIEIDDLFRDMDLTTLAYEYKTAIATGGIRTMTAKSGLSLGDRACLITAKQNKRIALTADSVWLDYQESINVKVEMIR
ncbi:MAG: PIN domain-containing protein [Methylococcales bacterium]